MAVIGNLIRDIRKLGLEINREFPLAEFAVLFHAVKNLPIGDGGMLTTDDPSVYERLMRLRWMGIDRSTFQRNAEGYQWQYEVDEVGYKYHMNDVAAAVGLAQLKHVEQWNERRRALRAIYKRRLSDLAPRGLRFVEDTDGAVSASHLCAIRVPDRDRLIDHLRREGIGTGVHYRPNHHYEPYLNDRRGDMSVTDRAYGELVSLPLHVLLTDAQALEVSGAVRAALG